jgi:hypothetical protein
MGGVGWPYILVGVGQCIGEDFNVTLFPNERSGEARFSTAMIEFSDFISDQGFVDLPLAGGMFAWSNNRDLPSWCHIDSFLFLRNGKSSILFFSKESFIDCALITSLSP